jgi:PAS domain S-box-containing protein
MDVAVGAIEPKWSEETPKESEDKFRLLFEESPDAMFLLDEHVFVDCNQAAVEMMRCSSKEQLLALHLYDISPEWQPDGRLSSEKARDLIATAFREGSARFEWVHSRMDDEKFPVEVLLTAIQERHRHRTGRRDSEGARRTAHAGPGGSAGADPGHEGTTIARLRPDPPRAGSAGSDGRGVKQPGDRRAAGGQSLYRQVPRQQHPLQVGRH